MVRVYDAEGTVMGRLASTAAKALLKGESVVIVNAEKAVITGARLGIIQEYRHKRELGTYRFGPFYPRRPDRVLRRVVRGMLPFYRAHGKAAFQRLQVHVGVPAELKKNAGAIQKIRTRRGTDRYIVLGELCKALGAEF